MLQGCVAGTCSRDQSAELAHMWKSQRDVFQGHVAATHPLVCAGTFYSRNMKFMLREWKSASAHERMCRCNMSAGSYTRRLENEAGHICDDDNCEMADQSYINCDLMISKYHDDYQISRWDDITVQPLLSGRPPLSVHVPKTRFFCQ